VTKTATATDLDNKGGGTAGGAPPRGGAPPAQIVATPLFAAALSQILSHQD